MFYRINKIRSKFVVFGFFKATKRKKQEMEKINHTGFEKIIKSSNMRVYFGGQQIVKNKSKNF